MGRRRAVKPRGKEKLCWSWRRGLKAVGMAAERRGDTESVG